MKKVHVLVVPETEDFTEEVSHNDVVWISKKLGKPDLEGRNARYLAPYWLKEPVGVNRIYHIREVKEHETCYGLYLGNSFLLFQAWQGIAQRRRFEYWELKDFGFVEICPGLLTRVFNV